VTVPKKTTDPAPAGAPVPEPAAPEAEAPPAKRWKASAKGMPELVVEAADEKKAREAYVARLKLNRAAPVAVKLVE
jgi:hypothetical protein